MSAADAVTPERPPVDEMFEAEMLRELVRNTRETRDDIAKIVTVVESVSDQVKPTLDSLMKNPMFKMLLK